MGTGSSIESSKLVTFDRFSLVPNNTVSVFSLLKDSLFSISQTNFKFSSSVVNTFRVLLHEYRDLFIDMAVRNNRSELAIGNRHQER